MRVSTQISIGFLIIISIDLIDSWVNYSLTQEVSKNTAFLTKSETIIRNSNTLNRSVVEIQSAFRGFLLTGDETFLIPYKNDMEVIPTLLKQEKTLVTNSKRQRARLDSIFKFHKLWLNYADLIINAKRKAIAHPDSAKEYSYLFETQFKKQVGTYYTEIIAGIFRSFDRNEYRIRESRRRNLEASIKQTKASSIFFSTLTILVGIVGTIYVVKKISLRINSMVKLAGNITLGDFNKISDDKQDELSDLSTSLNLMSDRLFHNIRQLEKKNEELQRFSYVVSHDLKAPIRGIYNVTQWIAEDLDDEISPKMRSYLQIIQERIQRIENLIDGLLEYARVGRDKTTKELVKVSVIVQELAEVIVPPSFEFVTEDLPDLFTEKLLLQQVLSNLISNAVKHMPTNYGRIKVICKDKEGFYEFHVIDNGPGIKADYHYKIFEIFQTLREKHDKESTGIGLAIVKKIVEDKNCTIKVLSSLGNGANFVFTWPKIEYEKNYNSVS